MYGDCCEDVGQHCELDECSFTDNGKSVGCADGEFCMPGVCLAFCLAVSGVTTVAAGFASGVELDESISFWTGEVGSAVESSSSM